MKTDQLIDHQIAVEVTLVDGTIRLKLPNHNEITWPVTDSNLTSGQFYLTLSKSKTLPSKEELARLILTEILKSND